MAWGAVAGLAASLATKMLPGGTGTGKSAYGSNANGTPISEQQAAEWRQAQALAYQRALGYLRDQGVPDAQASTLAANYANRIRHSTMEASTGVPNNRIIGTPILNSKTGAQYGGQFFGGNAVNSATGDSTILNPNQKTAIPGGQNISGAGAITRDQRAAGGMPSGQGSGSAFPGHYATDARQMSAQSMQQGVFSPGTLAEYTGEMRPGGYADAFMPSDEAQKSVKAYMDRLDPLKGIASNPAILKRLESLAMGKGQTVAEQVGRAQQDQLARGMGAVAARAGYNPAALRGTGAQQARMGQDLAGEISGKASAERLAMAQAALEERARMGQLETLRQAMAQELLSGEQGRRLSAFNALLAPDQIAAGLAPSIIGAQTNRDIANLNASIARNRDTANMIGGGATAAANLLGDVFKSEDTYGDIADSLIDQM